MRTDSAPITPPLLRLPSELRRRIYFRAGLAPVDRDRAPLVLDLHGDFGFDSVRPGFHGLLLSCRAIYDEASELLYSLNRFVIRMPPASPYAMYMPQHTGLAPLRALTDSSLASLRHLKIVLSEASCHPRKQGLSKGQCCDYVDLQRDPCIPRLHPCGQHEPVGHDGPLKDSNATQTVLAEWQSTVESLSGRGVSLASLELSLVCDVQPHQPEIARLAVAPLASLAPLKDCHIRLCREHSTQIQEIADDAVLKARGISAATQSRTALKAPGASGSPSRLLALPRELRLRILEYTDLITPWREVTWNRCSAQYWESRTGWRNVDGMRRTCPPWVHRGCQFSQCWITFPGADLYHDAQVVFISGNRFVVHDFDPLVVWKHPPVPADGGYPNDRFAISVFLKDIVPTACLSLLRFVEIVFPPYPHDSWPQDGDDSLEDWIDCVHRLKYNANLPALTLRLYMVDTSEFRPQRDREQLTKDDGQKVLKAYTRILGPISELGDLGLARFYAHFVWPWTWTEAVQSRVREGDSQWLLHEEAALKERAERWVMGTRYNAFNAVDAEPQESLWRLTFYRDC
ncbi:hypothetical protein KVR01_004019 [Diaporthe batatas]|uniref:uncharacterized protein n=1 Tax=Diaporthe batatas TaxID=748121 RepID=UPI001D04B162|nr:uncharacterized protein KVR01_004019 [Diaporthe batatas]KAG8165467.1 hypothetical protein KVR01_004019 [Diaporthe batatas]